MLITYDFGYEDYDDDYDYDADIYEYVDSLPEAEKINLAKRLWEEMSEVDKEDFLNGWKQYDDDFELDLSNYDQAVDLIYNAPEEDIYELDKDDIREFFYEYAVEDRDEYNSTIEDEEDMIRNYYRDKI